MDSNNGLEIEINVSNDSEVPISTVSTVSTESTDQTSPADNADNGLNVPESDPKDSQPNDTKANELIECQKSASEELVASEPIGDNCSESVGQTDESTKPTRHQYSKDQLIAISKLSSARMRPKCLDHSFNNPENGLWDPEKWMSSKSPAQPMISSTNKHNYSKRDESLTKKSNNDLKDRVIEEENDIILSPQRGSFGTGCHVSATSFGSNKTGSDSRNREHFNDRNKLEDTSDGSHRQNMNHRRVGTGRIVPKERERSNDWNERTFDRERSYEHRSDGRETGRDRDNRSGDDYSDRRNRRFFDRRPNVNNRNNRYENDRYRDHNRYEEDEPEWFTEGPTSKHDTIELKGFDDDTTDQRKERKGSMGEKPNESRSENKDSVKDNQNKNQKDSAERDVNEVKTESKNSEDFDVNEFLKTDDWFRNGYETSDTKISSMDGISIADNSVDKSDSNGKSRFNRWFKSGPTSAQFNDNSQKNESNVVKNESNSGQRESRGATSSAPSAHTPTNQIPNAFSAESNERHIFDLLKGANRLSMDQMMHNKLGPMPSKAVNVSEIEANFKQMDVNNEKNDKRAFDKFFNDFGKKSAQTLNASAPDRAPERVQSYGGHKGEATIFQTLNSNIIVPKTQQQILYAPTILELLKEEENKAALEARAADSQRTERRVFQNPSVPQQRNGSNISATNVSQMHNNLQMMAQSMPNPMAQDWQNTSPHMKTVRPRQVSNQELNDNTNFILQSALLKRQQMKPNVRAQQLNETIRANTPIKGMSNSNFFTPTSVIRKMHLHSEKDKDSAKTVTPFDDMASESTSSQQKFVNQLLNPKPAQGSPRAIIKSNNPMAQSMVANKALQSPLSPQSDSSPFGANPEPTLNSYSGFASQQQLLLQQHFQQQQQHSLHNTSTQHMPSVKSHQRPVNPSLSNAHLYAPLSLAQSSLTGAAARPSTPSPNANNNMQMNSIPNVLQMFNQSTVRPKANAMQINQMLAIQALQQIPQQSTPNEFRHSQHSQYSQSRPITATNIQQMLSKGPNAEQFKSTYDRNLWQESEHMKQSVSTTYGQHSRPQMFVNSNQPNANLSSDSRFLGQLFGTDQTVSEMPPVPKQNALTLDDIERH